MHQTERFRIRIRKPFFVLWEGLTKCLQPNFDDLEFEFELHFFSQKSSILDFHIHLTVSSEEICLINFP